MSISFRSLRFNRSSLSALTLGSLLLAAPLAVAAPVKTYQVTGPVLEVTDTTITVEKDKEKWQIFRDKDTKVTGEIKPGAKVTVQYRMSATTIDVKGDAKGDAKADTKADAKSDGKPAKEKAAKK
jgi:hypothetical protein